MKALAYNSHRLVWAWGLPMTRIIAVANQKGGVGKTTTCVNLSFSLTLLGQKVLICDIDPQGNSTSSLGIENSEDTPTSAHILADDDSIEQAVAKTHLRDLCIVPASSELLSMEKRLTTAEKPLLRLGRALDRIKKDWDFIFIDCPPSLGLLPLNAMAAANAVLIPVQAEFLPMEGLSQIVTAIEEITTTVNQHLEIEGVLLTMFDYQKGLTKEVEDEIKKHFKNKVFKTRIARDESLASAPSFGRPALEYDVRSLGARDYIKLAKEILDGTG